MAKSKNTSINLNVQGGHDKDWKCHKGTGGAVYFLGFVGAVIYYIQAATGFWDGVLGILKAIVWPAFVVYHLLGL